MNNLPLVSVIMPAYNSSKFIGESIESVINQTYPNWELLIVDDCSKDNTWDIICNYAKSDKRIKVFKNENNSGQVFSRNKALKIANGKYIAFLDSDDLWKEHKLEIQMDLMQKNNLPFTFSSYERINVEGKKIGKDIKVPKTINAKKILKNTIIGCLTVVIDRSIVGEFEMPNLKQGEDTFTWFNILNRGFTATGIQEVLASYRVSFKSSSGNKLKAAKLYWKALKSETKLSFFTRLYYFNSYAIHEILKRL